MIILHRLAALLCLCAVAACDDPSGPRPPEGVGSLEMVSGDRFAAPPGTLVPEEARVRVLSPEGAPVAGVQVCFSAKDGATIVSGAESPTQSCRATDAQGIASVQWRLGLAAGLQTLVASVPGLPRVTFTARAGSGTPVQLYLTTHSLYLHAIRDTGYVGVRGRDAEGFTIRLPFTVSANPYAAMAAVGDSVRAIALDPGGHWVYVASAANPQLRDSLYVEVSPRTVNIALGERRLAVGVGDTAWIPVVDLRDARGYSIRSRPITWSTTIPGATVRTEVVDGRPYGVLQGGASPGTGTVTATADGVSASTEMRVLNRLSGVGRLTLSDVKSCGLDAEGQVLCWGSLGTLPTPVPGLGNCWLPGISCWPWAVPVFPGQRFSRVDTYSAGATCVLDVEGRASCAESGALVPVNTALRFREISVGTYLVCALTADGAAHCWRPRSSSYPEGTPPAPAPVGDARFATLSAGDGHACGVTTTGTGRCWVLGSEAVDDPDNVLTPGGNAGGMQLRSITAGNSFSCAVDTNGQAYCWGRLPYGNFGQLGRGSETTGGPVSSTTRFATVDANGQTVCALAEDGQAWCWGSKSKPFRFDGVVVNNKVPTLVPGGVRFTSVVAGDGHACGVNVAGTVQCWYHNRWGNLGNGRVSGIEETPQHTLRWQ